MPKELRRYKYTKQTSTISMPSKNDKGEWGFVKTIETFGYIINAPKPHWTHKPVETREVWLTPEQRGFFKEVTVKIIVTRKPREDVTIHEVVPYKYKVTPNPLYDPVYLKVVPALIVRGKYELRGKIVQNDFEQCFAFPMAEDSSTPSVIVTKGKPKQVSWTEAKRMVKSGEALGFMGSDPKREFVHPEKKLKL